MKKRFLPYAMAASMVLTTIPSPVLAAEDVPAAQKEGGVSEQIAEYELQRNTSAAQSASAGERLSPLEKKIYDELKAKLKQIADGELTSTSLDVETDLSGLRWSASDLDLDTLVDENNNITNEAGKAARKQFADAVDYYYVYICLLADCPYELYWHTSQISWQIRADVSEDGQYTYISRLTYRFRAADEYAYNQQGYMVDADKMNAAKAAVDYAQKIVEKYAQKSDREKLEGYKKEICDLVSYNKDAAADVDVTYSNPWNIVSVFDQNPDTNVVCEGYAKAFKYLCDLSDFDDEVICYLVSGQMRVDQDETSPHMWNVVLLDGQNLMVDITNCDEGETADQPTIGYPDKLFLAKANSSDAEDGRFEFRIGGKVVVYWDAEMDMFCDGYLKLAETDSQMTKIDAPTGKALTYDGTEQTGVEAGAGYKLTGSTATNAGDYTAIATPEEGYEWSDSYWITTGPAGEREIPWYIAKAPSEKKMPTTLETTSNEFGVFILGTDSDMEYADNATFGSAKVCDDGETEVPEEGVYYVRYAETKNYLPTDAIRVAFDGSEEPDSMYTVTLTRMNGDREVLGTYKPGQLATITAPKEPGFSFVEWIVLSGDIQLAHSDRATTTFTMGEQDVELYAAQGVDDDTVIVAFDANGGTIDGEESVTKWFPQEEEATLPVPTRSGYTFLGWFTDAVGGEQITADSVKGLEDYTVLYAHWSRNSGGGGSSSGGGGGSSAPRPTTPVTPATDNKSETKTVTNPDGSTTTTVTNPNGSSVETTTYPDGSKLVTETDENGAQTITETRADGTEVRTEISRRGEVTSKVTLPDGADEVTVKIPTENRPTAGTVAVIVNPDGTREIILYSSADRDGVTITLDRDATVEIIDNARVFNDVPSSSWAKESIDFVTARELFAGVSDTEFGHNSPMTRAMLMTVLARLDGQDTSGGATWYEKGMNWAVAKGISDGTSPNGTITREQLAAMLYRYAGSPATSGNLDIFLDSGRVSGYAVDALRWAVEQGIISGMGDGTLNPQGNATRAQVAAMLMRFMNAMN